jgi:transketolase
MNDTPAGKVDQQKIHQLQEISWNLSRKIIEITTRAESGHPSSSLSIIDLLTGLYFGGILRYDANRPDWPDRDRFILSKGHAAPALYVVLANAGFFKEQLLETYRQISSPLEGHPNMSKLSGVEASTGSLGQGLSLGLGHCLAAKVDGRDYRVWVLVGDGEVNQGQIWEATMSAAKYNLDHLTVILDHNKFQQTGPVSEVMPSLPPFFDKWRAFGWYVIEVDGHDMTQIMNAFEQVQSISEKPQLIVAHTLKGKGLTQFEADLVTRKHGAPLKQEELGAALEELDAQYKRLMETEDGSR